MLMINGNNMLIIIKQNTYSFVILIISFELNAVNINISIFT